MNREDISEAEKESYARRLCAYMGFEVSTERRGTRRVVVSARGGRLPLPSLSWTFFDWDHALFGIDGDSKNPGLDGELRFRAALYDGSFRCGFDLGKFKSVESETLAELDVKLSAMGFKLDV